MSTQLVDLIRPALAAMRHATAALFGTDPPTADNVGAAYEALSTLRYEIEDHAAVLLAARDRSTLEELPATIAAVHINAEVEHMGQLAREVAEIARTRHERAPIPAPLLRVLRELSEVCLDIAAKASDVVESHGAVGVVELDAGDDEVVLIAAVALSAAVVPIRCDRRRRGDRPHLGRSLLRTICRACSGGRTSRCAARSRRTKDPRVVSVSSAPAGSLARR